MKFEKRDNVFQLLERLPIKPYIREGFPKNLTSAVGGAASFSCPSITDLATYMQWIKPNPCIDDTETLPIKKCCDIIGNVPQGIVLQVSITARL